jgi:hypothetical protein
MVKRVSNILAIGNCIGACGGDPELRELCDIEEYEKHYHPSQLTRFRQRIGSERLSDAGAVKGEIVV